MKENRSLFPFITTCFDTMQILARSTTIVCHFIRAVKQSGEKTVSRLDSPV